MAWPNHFPRGCPPEEAEAVSAEVYRLVHTPIQPADFESVRQKNPDRRFPQAEKACQACGLSVFANIADAEKLRNRIKGLRSRAIGAGRLTPEMGVLKPTPSRSSGQSHCTWWAPIGIEPWTIFQSVTDT